jgi:ribosome maturation protein SDO1
VSYRAMMFSQSWHREKDINEVVQTTTVFSNVSKGVLAKREDLQAVFATDDEEAICRIILSEGDFQVPLLRLRTASFMRQLCI